jgi:hypothetical protein
MGNTHGRHLCQITATRGLPVLIAAIALPHPVRPCFPDPESRNFNRLCLISFRSRARARMRRAWAMAGRPRASFRSRARARMRRYDTFWMAEHDFQPEGTELVPNLLMMAMHLCGVTRNLEDRLRLQHRADVASAAPRRGLRDGRHPDRRPLESHDGPVGPYLAALSDQSRATLREHVRRGFLCNRPDGPRSFASTAWACRGT